MHIIYEEGFDFGFDPAACEQCRGYCCRGASGHIWVNQPDILRISRHLKSNPIDCMEAYMTPVGNRISIRERTSGKEYLCVFFEPKTSRCSIYEVRPMQCRRFPFWDHFRNRRDLAMRECPGVRVKKNDISPCP